MSAARRVRRLALGTPVVATAVAIASCGVEVDIGGEPDAGDAFDGATPTPEGSSAESSTPVDGGSDATPPACDTTSYDFDAPVLMAELGATVLSLQPFITSDDLVLWVTQASGSDTYVARTQRASTGVLFPAPVAVRDGGGAFNALPAPVSAVDGEVFFVDNGDLVVSKNGGPPATVATPTAPATFRAPWINRAGTHLYVASAEATDVILERFSRQSASSGFALDATAGQKLPVGGVFVVNNAHFSFALSADELELYLTLESKQMVVYKRGGVDAAFSPTGTIIPLTVVGNPSSVAFPRSLSRDSCEMYLSSNASGVTNAYRARRKK